MATTSQNLESIASNVANIAKEMSIVLDRQSSTVDVQQVQNIVNTTLASKNYATAFDYNKYLEKAQTASLTVGLPVVWLTGNTAGMSKDNKVDLSYKYGSPKRGYVEGTCTCKWQGASSVSYVKKNYTLGKMTPAINAGWGTQKKHVLKANYIDYSHCRNIICAKLWGQIVRKRTGTDEITTRLKALPNGGAIDGFPVMLVINNEYQGVYTFNIPKDDWLFGMIDGAGETILSGDAHSDTNAFKQTITAEQLAAGTPTEIEFSNMSDESVLNSINTAITAAINSTGSNYRSTLEQYVDIQSAIDYFIFCRFIGNPDGLKKNHLICTYDGVKWFLSPYDLDNTLGIQWFGSTFLNAKSMAPATFKTYADSHRLMHLIYTYDKDALRSRIIELRDTVFAEENIENLLINFSTLIPEDCLVADREKWHTIPSTHIDQVGQILNWYRMRCKLIDEEVESWGPTSFTASTPQVTQGDEF